MATLSNAEETLLKKLTATVRTALNTAWLLTVISSLLFAYQSWLLAHIFSLWLNNYFNEMPIATGLTSLSSGWFVGLALCFLIRPLLNSGRELLGTAASLKVRSQLRASLLTTMAKLGPNLRYFGSDGSLSSQMIDQIDALDGFISRFSVQKKVTVSTPAILLVAVAWQSKFAAALMLITAPLVPIFMILIGHLTARKSAAQFSALSQLSGRFLDWIRGMPTLKRLQATHIAEHDLAISSEEYRRRTMDVLKIAFLNGAVLELLGALSIALVAVYLGFGLMGILPWDKGQIPVPYFGALFILLLAPEFYAPLRQLGADYHAKAQAEGAVQSLLPLIEAGEGAITAQDNQDSLDNQDNQAPAKEAATANTSLIALSKPFGLRLTNLSIKAPLMPATTAMGKETENINMLKGDALYSDEVNNDTLTNNNTQPSSQAVSDNKPTYRTRLAPISFTINPSERIALVGDSGSGKSSLIQALMGFVDYHGSIELMPSVTSSINKKQNKHSANPTAPTTPTAIALSDICIDDLRQHIGYLAQQVALMPLTIAENLRLANPHATDSQLIDVLDKVGLWQLVKRLPSGMATELGERGQGLSGGQQQRLGIAQLLLRNDSLWLLDEPTEHLDPDTAEHIHRLLEKVSRGKTVIWITHSHEQLPWLDKVVKLALPQTHHLQQEDD